jgi:hypothetical protein
MRRIIIFIVIGIVVIFGLTRVFSKGKSKGANKATANSARAVKGKTTGAIKAKTREEIVAEQRRVKREERKRLRELRRQQRVQARARRLAGYYGGYGYNYGRRRSVRGTRRGYGYSTSRTSRRNTNALYKLSAIFIIEGRYYAMIDNLNYTVGDAIAGRKIVEILSDRIIIDESGQNREVKVGQSVSSGLSPQSGGLTAPGLIQSKIGSK